MSQVSPPLRIALVAAIAFLGVWTFFLSPQPESPVAADPAAVATSGPPVIPTDPAAAREAAKNASTTVAAADARAGALSESAGSPTDLALGGPAATGAAAGATTAQSAAATTAAPGAAPSTAPAPAIELNREALAKLPVDVRRAVEADKVVAILFWNSRAPEDRRVRRALRDANTHGERVFVRAAPVSDIARYAPVTRGVDVAQSPTLVVVDADLHAEALVGYVARTTIRQALSDALRAS